MAKAASTEAPKSLVCARRRAFCGSTRWPFYLKRAARGAALPHDAAKARQSAAQVTPRARGPRANGRRWPAGGPTEEGGGPLSHQLGRAVGGCRYPPTGLGRQTVDL